MSVTQLHSQISKQQQKSNSQEYSQIKVVMGTGEKWGQNKSESPVKFSVINFKIKLRWGETTKRSSLFHHKVVFKQWEYLDTLQLD